MQRMFCVKAGCIHEWTGSRRVIATSCAMTEKLREDATLANKEDTMDITYKKLNKENFSEYALDHFIRYQKVTQCWRNEDGEWKLKPIAFEENWPLAQCREIAADVALHMEKDQTAFGAFDGKKIVGFITVSHEQFGTTAKYVELVCFQVSEPYRGQGIGRALFKLACDEAGRLGADKMYISGHSSKESQAAYKALGCVHAQEINEKIAQGEPFDVQLEYALVCIETQRLILRRFRKDDLQDLYEYLSDGEVVRFEPYKPMNMQKAAENLKWRISMDEMVAVELKSTGKMIGNIYLGKRDYDSLEIGFVFNRQYWGQGYATESCKEMMKRAFSKGVHRIYAECDPNNLGSCGLLERLGFKREAHFRKNVYFWKDIHGDPIWKDSFIYGILREDTYNDQFCQKESL